MKKLLILPALLIFMGNSTFAAESQNSNLSTTSIENIQENEEIGINAMQNQNYEEHQDEDNLEEENALDGKIIQNFYYGECGDSDRHDEKDDEKNKYGRYDEENDNEEEMVAVGGASGAAGLLLGVAGMWIWNRRKEK